MSRLLWRILDPLLVRLQSRLDHLRRLRGTDLSADRWSASAEFGSGVKVYPEAVIENRAARGQLRVAAFCHLRGHLAILTPEGTLELGHHSFVGPGSRIWVQGRVQIGSHVLISHLVDIHDTDAHALDAELRREDGLNLFERGHPVDWSRVAHAPVIIEDDAWIGFKSSILKGVTIGRGAVIGAASVVTKDVPAFSLVAGNPARVIRRLSSAQPSSPRSA